MANTTVEILGGKLDGSVLENAASEATLREIAQVLNGRGVGSQQGGMNQGPLSKAISGVTSTATNVSKTSVNLAKMMFEGNSSMSSYTRTINDGLIKQLPVVGNFLGGIGTTITGTIQQFESWNNTLRGLTGVGATFNNSIIDMMHASVRTYMTLDEFSGVVRQNAPKFLNFGNTITQGIQTYSDLSFNLMRANGPARNTLIQLGYSTQQINQQFINYLDKIYRGVRLETVDRNRVAESFVRYQTNIHNLTAITGKTQERIEKEMEVVTNNQSIRIEMNNLTTDQREQMNSLLTQYSALYGTAGAEMFAAAFNNFAPQTSRATHLHYLNPQLYNDMRSLISTVRSSGTGINNFDETLRNFRRRELRRMIDTYRSNEFLFRAQASGDTRLSAFLEAFEGPLGFITRFGSDVDSITDDQIDDLLRQVDGETANRDALTRSLRDFENMIRDFRVGFYDVIFGENGPLRLLVGPNSTMPNFSVELRNAGRSLGTFVTEIIPKLALFLGRFVTPEGRELFKVELESLMKSLSIRLSYLIMRTFSDDPKFSVEAMQVALQSHDSAMLPVLTDLYARYERSIREFTERMGITMGQGGRGADTADPGYVPPAPPTGGGTTLPPNPAAARPAMIDRTADQGQLGLGGQQNRVTRTIFHHTGGSTLSGAIATLRQRQLSYNYIIDRDGTINQLVQEGRRAWHAGRDNLDSIGVAMVARNDADINEIQLRAAAELQRYLSSRYGYSLTSAQGHGHVDPVNKPGEGMRATEYIRNLMPLPSGAQSQGTLGSLGRAFGNFGPSGKSTVSTNGTPLGQTTFTDLLRDTADVSIRNDIEIANSNLSNLVALLERRLSVGYKIAEAQAKRSGNLLELT